MIHLTFTGPNAGEPVCGTERDEDDMFVHWMYWKRITQHDKDMEGTCTECFRIIADLDEAQAEDHADWIRDQQEFEYDEE